eukprot:14414581-Ditylum_brightwellii.AAC.1
MHIRTDGTLTDCKTEAVFFPSATQSVESVDTSPVYVNDTGYVTYSNKFKYLGSYITQDLSDTYNLSRERIANNLILSQVEKGNATA